MDVTFARDEFGRLTCDLRHGGESATVTASNMPSAGTELIAALDKAASAGAGECFWQEVCGEYRWVFRRDGGTVRMAIMWSTGTLTGWEHVFWAEDDASAVDRDIRNALQLVAS